MPELIYPIIIPELDDIIPIPLNSLKIAHLSEQPTG